MGKIFIALSGQQQTEPSETKVILAEGMEWWNLSKLPFEQFIADIKGHIPPVNGNITEDRYRTDIWQCNVQDQYEQRAKWGLLLPTPATDRNMGYEYEVIHSLNLFAPEFLHPIFHVDDMGCWATPHRHTAQMYGQDAWYAQQENVDIPALFRTPKFAEYYKKITKALPYFWSNRDREKDWKDLDWHLCWAHILFGDLRRYQNTGKRQGTYLRESVDICIIMESLFIDDGSAQEIMQKLKDRSDVLLGQFKSDVISLVGKLYKLRSDFVHGRVFRRMEGFDDGTPTTEDFELLQKATSYLRYLLLAYTYLYISPEEFPHANDGVVQLLIAALSDETLRNCIRSKAGEILNLLD